MFPSQNELPVCVCISVSWRIESEQSLDKAKKQFLFPFSIWEPRVKE